MGIDALDVLRWGLYVTTVILGVALILWLLRDRALRRLEAGETAGGEPSRRTLAASSPVPDSAFMAGALSGIHLPVHWIPEGAPEIVPPVVLTTERDSPEAVARLLSDELVRLGYHLHPIAHNAADAVKDSNHLRIEVDATGPAVVATISVATGDPGG